MRYPSVKRLVAEFEISNRDAKLIREIMYATRSNGWLDSNLHTIRMEASLPEIVHNYYNSGIELISKVINSGHYRTYGSEYIESNQDTFKRSQGLDYVNMGGTYTNTIVHDLSGDTWRIASWGSIVESNPRRFSTND